MGSEAGSLKGVRILFVFGCLDLGGSERQGLQLATRLKSECQADIHILGLSEKAGVLAELCEKEGIPWHARKISWPRLWPLRLLNLARFSSELRKLAPDVLMPYYTLPNTVCGLTWKRVGVRLCVWNQRDEGLILTKGIWHRKAISNVPLIIANSAGGKNFLQQTYGLENHQVKLIHNGIQLAPLSRSREQWRESLGIGAGVFAACMIANLGPYKDHKTLLLAWRQVINRTTDLSTPPVLLLAGKPDSSEFQLKAFAERHGLGEAVRFLGKVDDVSGLLASSDLCVHSSLTEGCPNGILEAMAAGLPVVGTDIAGIREAVGPDGCKFLAPVGDGHALADRILLFAHDAVLRKKSGSLLKKRIAAEFTIDGMCGKTAELIRTALGEKYR